MDGVLSFPREKTRRHTFACRWFFEECFHGWHLWGTKGSRILQMEELKLGFNHSQSFRWSHRELWIRADPWNGPALRHWGLSALMTSPLTQAAFGEKQHTWVKGIPKEGWSWDSLATRNPCRWQGGCLVPEEKAWAAPYSAHCCGPAWTHLGTVPPGMGALISQGRAVPGKVSAVTFGPYCGSWPWGHANTHHVHHCGFPLSGGHLC